MLPTMQNQNKDESYEIALYQLILSLHVAYLKNVLPTHPTQFGTMFLYFYT